jgi:hypothetical protein
VPDRDARPERHVLAAGEAGVARACAEPRSRAEYAADIRQRAVLSQEREADASAAADAAVRRFDPRRAGLPEVSIADPAAYLDAHQAERPWLTAAGGCSPEVQRVFAALDQGGGHAHIRHEGWVTEEMSERRVAYLEDPAQIDPAKRSSGIDGVRTPEGPHRCRETTSRIGNPDAFAVAFVRGVEHPTVKAALDMAFTPGRIPRPVSLSIADLLGPDGHRHCTGWRLQPVRDSMAVAREHRAAWVDARAHGRHPDAPEPKAQPVGTFAGGTIVFAFGPTRARDGYEVVTMYPRPPRDERQGGSR